MTTTDSTISAAFRAAFESHPQRDTDPALAVDSARETASALIPPGVTGTFDDEALTFSADVATTIDQIPSLGIRAAMTAAGITEATDLGRHEHPDHPGSSDWAIHVYEISPGIYAAATNGDPVWSEQDAAAWAALMTEYGLDELCR